MKIETKFNLGDRVWILDSNQVKELPVTMIGLRVVPGIPVPVFYEFGGGKPFYENKVFASKQELLESL